MGCEISQFWLENHEGAFDRKIPEFPMRMLDFRSKHVVPAPDMKTARVVIVGGGVINGESTYLFDPEDPFQDGTPTVI